MPDYAGSRTPRPYRCRGRGGPGRARDVPFARAARWTDPRCRRSRHSRARARSMLDRFVGAARVWRSVSPVVLPGAGIRGTARDPVERARTDERPRVREETLFLRALQDAGIDLAEVQSVELRREPF